MKTFEYKMPEAMARIIIKNSKKKKEDALVEYVNTHYNLLYPCSKVITY